MGSGSSFIGETGPAGTPGVPGKDGVGIQSAAQSTDGKLTLTMTDGTTLGPFEVKGKEGMGIKTVAYDSAKGELSLTMSDDTIRGPFMIRGPAGAAGAQGIPGAPGKDGAAGKDGADGAQGIPGAKGDKGDQGIPGAKGDKGDQGIPGAKGDKGDQGIPGQGVTTVDIRWLPKYDESTLPSRYYALGKGSYSEFTTGALHKLPVPYNGASQFVFLLTHAPYQDASGGPMYQYAHVGRNIVFVRLSANATSWQAWTRTSVFPKIPGFENPAIQIGETNEGRDDNIYSLAFGSAHNATFTGMGLIPASRKAFTSTNKPILGTHISNGSEWGLYTGGWTSLVNVEANTGNTRIRGELNAAGGITTTNITASGNVNAPNLATNTRVDSLVNTNTLNDLKPKTLWCADGEICNVPTGKVRVQFPGVGVMDSVGRMHVSSSNDLYLLPKNGVHLTKDWGASGNLTIHGNTDIKGATTLNNNLTMTGGKLLTPPGANLCNSTGTICVDVAQIKDVIDNAAMIRGDTLMLRNGWGLKAEPNIIVTTRNNQKKASVDHEGRMRAWHSDGTREVMPNAA